MADGFHNSTLTLWFAGPQTLNPKGNATVLPKGNPFSPSFWPDTVRMDDKWPTGSLTGAPHRPSSRTDRLPHRPSSPADRLPPQNDLIHGSYGPVILRSRDLIQGSNDLVIR